MLMILPNNSDQNTITCPIILSASKRVGGRKLRKFFPIKYMTFFYFLTFGSVCDLMIKNPVIFPQKSEGVIGPAIPQSDYTLWL